MPPLLWLKREHAARRRGLVQLSLQSGGHQRLPSEHAPRGYTTGEATHRGCVSLGRCARCRRDGLVRKACKRVQRPKATERRGVSRGCRKGDIHKHTHNLAIRQVLHEHEAHTANGRSTYIQTATRSPGCRWSACPPVWTSMDSVSIAGGLRSSVQQREQGIIRRGMRRGCRCHQGHPARRGTGPSVTPTASCPGDCFVSALWRAAWTGEVRVPMGQHVWRTYSRAT